MTDMRLLRALVFTVGAATLGAEIAAARLLAPFFGASTIVWANTIATVLVALSVGYWLGGRLADRWPALEPLARWLLVASVLLALVPLVARPFLDLSVRAFDDIDVGAAVGSLVGVLALVAVPVLLLGAVSPWAIRLSVDRVEDAGRAAGGLYALSTLGSLVGTFLAALVLVPLVGTQRTFLVFAAAVALVAALALPRRTLLVPAAVGALLLVPTGTTKPAEDGARVLEERETPDQYARVVELPGGERRLELNEGQVFHSVWRRGSVLTGAYFDDLLTAPLSVLGRAPRSVAVLGGGAGTTVRAYGELFPGTEMDAVEIDGELFELGRRWFGLRDRPGLRLHAADARPFLRRARRRWEVIVVDAYRQPYIPFYLTSREFFRLTRARLEPGGAVVINVGHPEDSDALEQMLTAGLADSYRHVARDPFNDQSTILVASDRRPSAAALRAARVDPRLRPLVERTAARLAPPLAGGPLFTDDKAPVEWLIDRSIISYAAK